MDKFRSKLSAYNDGELDGRLSEKMSSHLRQCPACRQELAELKRVDGLVKEMADMEPGECFSLQVIAKIPSGERGAGEFSPRCRRFAGKVLEFAGSFFDQFFAESEGAAVLDEFGDFPPLSISHAYFGAAGLRISRFSGTP